MVGVWLPVSGSPGSGMVGVWLPLAAEWWVSGSLSVKLRMRSQPDVKSDSSGVAAIPARIGLRST